MFMSLRIIIFVLWVSKITLTIMIIWFILYLKKSTLHSSIINAVKLDDWLIFIILSCIIKAWKDLQDTSLQRQRRTDAAFHTNYSTPTKLTKRPVFYSKFKQKKNSVFSVLQHMLESFSYIYIKYRICLITRTVQKKM